MTRDPDRVRRLTEAIVGDNHGLYLRSASFHHWVDITARVIIDGADLAAGIAMDEEVEREMAKAALMDPGVAP